MARGRASRSRSCSGSTTGVARPRGYGFALAPLELIEQQCAVIGERAAARASPSDIARQVMAAYLHAAAAADLTAVGPIADVRMENGKGREPADVRFYEEGFTKAPGKSGVVQLKIVSELKETAGLLTALIGAGFAFAGMYVQGHDQFLPEPVTKHFDFGPLAARTSAMLEQ